MRDSRSNRRERLLRRSHRGRLAHAAGISITGLNSTPLPSDPDTAPKNVTDQFRQNCYGCLETLHRCTTWDASEFDAVVDLGVLGNESGTLVDSEFLTGTIGIDPEAGPPIALTLRVPKRV
jgi:hypothetical protein